MEILNGCFCRIELPSFDCPPPKKKIIIIHQDVKPANILIDTNGNYCITDFSIKFGMEDERNLDNESSGTTICMPPERFTEGYIPYTSCDIWAFGATIYELLIGDVPLGNKGGAVQLDGGRIPAIKKLYPRK